MPAPVVTRAAAWVDAGPTRILALVPTDGCGLPATAGTAADNRGEAMETGPCGVSAQWDPKNDKHSVPRAAPATTSNRTVKRRFT